MIESLQPVYIRGNGGNHRWYLKWTKHCPFTHSTSSAWIITGCQNQDVKRYFWREHTANRSWEQFVLKVFFFRHSVTLALADWKKMLNYCHRLQRQSYSVRLCLSEPLLGNLIVLIILLFMQPCTLRSKFGNGISPWKLTRGNSRSVTLKVLLAWAHKSKLLVKPHSPRCLLTGKNNFQWREKSQVVQRERQHWERHIFFLATG